MDTGLSGFIKKLPLERRLVTAVDEIARDVFVLRIDRKHDFARQVLVYHFRMI